MTVPLPTITHDPLPPPHTHTSIHDLSFYDDKVCVGESFYFIICMLVSAIARFVRGPPDAAYAHEFPSTLHTQTHTGIKFLPPPSLCFPIRVTPHKPYSPHIYTLLSQLCYVDRASLDPITSEGQVICNERLLAGTNSQLWVLSRAPS